MTFLKITLNLKDFNPDSNIWEASPQLKYYEPYGSLYEADATKDKSFSSRQVWSIIFFCYPDEEDNIFFRHAPSERKEKIMERYGRDIDWDDPLFQKCLDKFPNDCMTVIQREYAMEKDKFLKRANLIRDTELTLDTTDPHTGKLIKGTAMQITALQKAADKVYEEYLRIEELFKEEKAQIRMYGGGSVPVIDRDQKFWDDGDN